MFRVGIILESLEHIQVLNELDEYFLSEREEQVENDIEPIWHIREYRLPESTIEDYLDLLKEEIKYSWYIHAFSKEQLYVIMKGRYFHIAQHRDETWDEMIEYGVTYAKVERSFLENITLNI